MPNSQNKDSMNDSFVYAFMIIGAVYGTQFLYEHNTEFCNNIIMTIDKWLLYPFSVIPGSVSGKIINGFHWNDPGMYGWEHMVTLTAEMGKYWRWIFSPLMFYMAWVAYTRSSIANMYQRSFSMRELVKNNVKAFPCMAPVANIDILGMDLHEGPWRLVLSPLQFAVRHELIVDKEGKLVDRSLLLNKRTQMANEASTLLAKKGNDGIHLIKEKAVKILSDQVGAEFIKIDALPDHIKGLSAAFMAYGAVDKEAGQAMLDHMSLTYKADNKGNPISVSITGVKELIKKYRVDDAEKLIKKTNFDSAEDLLKRYRNDERILEATKYHTAYVSTWMIALLTFARGKGVLACSQFIWLRPMDRQMFYTLNQVGGRRPWSESIGPWVHYDYERMAKQPIYEMFMEEAVNDLAAEIAGLGFLDEKLITKKH